jgi:hypothetical protein
MSARISVTWTREQGLSTLGLSIYQEVRSGATTVTERTLCPVLVGRHSELAIVEDALIDAARSDGRGRPA